MAMMEVQLPNGSHPVLLKTLMLIIKTKVSAANPSVM
jgi:hypothetical protein